MAKKIYTGSNEELEVLQYIESTGTQYIDTGVIPNGNTRVVAKMEFTSATQTEYAGMFGTQIDGNNTYGYTFTNIPGNTIRFKGSSNYMGGPIYAVNTIYEVDCSLDTYIINETTYTNTDIWSQDMDETIYIWGRNSEGAVLDSTLTIAKLYYFQIYQNNVLVRDFVPVLDEQGKAFLFDKVSQTKFFNKGTGNFIAGEIASDLGKINIKNNSREVKAIYTTENRGFKPLQYIESTGTQYIDVGISGNAIGTYEIKFNMLGEGYQNYEMYFAGPLSAQVPKLYLNGDTTIVADIGTTVYELFTKDNNAHVIKVTDTEILCDDVVKATYTAAAWGDKNFWLFSAAEQPSLYSTMRLYYLKMYSDGILVRDFIPIQDEEGNICLYDEVSQTKFLNQGTGNFIAGPQNSPAKKVKKGYIGVEETFYPVECIESNTIQQIFLDYYPNQNTKMETEVMFNNITNTENIWCARTSSDGAGVQQAALWKIAANFRIDYGSVQKTVTDLTLIKDKKYKVCIDKNKFYVDDNLLFTHTEEEFQSPNPLALLASYWTDRYTSVGNYAQLKMYYLKIYENDILVKDLVPVRNSKGVYGLYDKIDRDIFYSTPVAPLTGGEIIDENIMYKSSKAKQFFGEKEKELKFLGPTTRRAVSKGAHAAASIGNYALIAGGDSGNSTPTATVDAYDINLLHSTPTSLSTARYWFDGDNNNNYAIFGGGWSSSKTMAVDAYNSSLTRTTPTTLSQARSTLGAASNGPYVIFAGGESSSTVDAYNDSLTKSSPTSLSKARKEIRGCRFGNYACFLGGYNTNKVDFYNTSLTRSNPTNLTNTVREPNAGANSKYVFACGGATTKYVNAYDANLVKYTPTQLSEARSGAAMLNFGDYLVIAGGGSTNSFAEVYDTNLVHSIYPGQTGAGFRGARVGKYGLVEALWSTYITVFKYE
ncbi:MAG: hypothetical protein J6B87_06230 [Clostridia bacterium]|nr:hypothetical protein [Clostridia bacterium]